MVEDSGRIDVLPTSDVGAGLLVEPPMRQAKLGGNCPGLLNDDTVLLKHRVDVASRSAGIVCQCHRRAAENVDVRDHATALQLVAEAPEGVLDGVPVEQRIVCAHATFNSCGATKTPRRRNAAGAWTTASTRADRVLKGNQKRRSVRDSVQAGAACPSSAAKCSATAASLVVMAVLSTAVPRVILTRSLRCARGAAAPGGPGRRPAS